MRLSVVVAVLDGGDALRRCLAGLAAQQGAPELEVLVPLEDEARAEVEALAELPAARVVPIGALATPHPPGSWLDRHERVDRRRAAGLAAAGGDAVALLEDRVVPRPDWAAALARALLGGADAVGGAVAPGRRDPLRAAVYYADYGRYQPPFPSGPADALTDVNVAYRRDALAATREHWEGRYHESTLHPALRARGARLERTPDAVVEAQRDPLRLGPLLRERLAFGRVFGATRVAGQGAARRALYALATPLLPPLLLLRLVRQRAARGPLREEGFAAALPALALLLTAWSLGELRACLGGEA